MTQENVKLDPRRQVKDFVEGFHDAVVNTEEDLETVVDRFHAPGMLQIADGHAMDRDKLLAHARGVRRTKPDMHIEILDAMTHSDRIAARYLMHVSRMRSRGSEGFSIEVHEFAEFAEDGRLRRADTLTRRLPTPSPTSHGKVVNPQLAESDATVVATRNYRVVGMTCDHCAKTVTEEILRVAGVESVRVDVAGEAVAVSSRDPIEEAWLRVAVEQAGYEFAGPA